MRTTLTISLPTPLRKSVANAAKKLGLSQSEFVRRALRQLLWDEAFEASRRILAPIARSQGIFMDEDVFRSIS